MRCNTRSRFLWKTQAFPFGPLVKICPVHAFAGSGTILVFFSAKSPSVDRAPTHHPPEDKGLVSRGPGSSLPGLKRLGIYPRLPTETGCDTRSGLTWGTRARTLGPLVQNLPILHNFARLFFLDESLSVASQTANCLTRKS